MYGTRARIGYTSPLLVSEIFPYEFYQLVPSGVTLALITLDVWGVERRPSFKIVTIEHCGLGKLWPKPVLTSSSSEGFPCWRPKGPRTSTV